jgi:serine O-acetyltransferase
MTQKRFNPIQLYFWANSMYRRHIPILPKVLQTILFFGFNAVVPFQAQIGRGSALAHGGSGVVLHEAVKIGERVLICQQVTIGGSGYEEKVPEIGDDCYLGAGAKILGPITIGEGCVIGANAVVVKSVPAHCVAVGVPARVIRENIDAHQIERW